MKQFAIYFIPSDINFYKVGSELIGYDILNESKETTSKDQLIASVQKVNSKSNQYGLHLTLTDVVEISDKKISQAMMRSKLIFALPIFRNIKIEKDKIDFMPNANVFAIQYKHNFRLFLLHFLLVLFVQTLGKNSDYSNNINMMNFWRRFKTRVFLSPYIFDDFIPHMTIVSSSSDPDKKLKKYLNKVFEKFQSARIDRLALVIKDKNEGYFKVKDFISR